MNGNAGPAAGQCVCPLTSPLLVWESSTLSMGCGGTGDESEPSTQASQKCPTHFDDSEELLENMILHIL